MLFRTLLVALVAAVAIGTACWVVSNETLGDGLPTGPQSKVQPQAIYGPIEVMGNIAGYCLCEKCCGKWAGVFPRVTASGHEIQNGDKFVAAPREYPFGTMISIPGYNDGKPVPVLDRGGAITGSKFDLYFPTHQEALRWGRQRKTVQVWK